MDERLDKTPSARPAAGGAGGGGKMRPFLDWFLIALMAEFSVEIFWYSFFAGNRVGGTIFHTDGNWWSLEITNELMVNFDVQNFRIQFPLLLAVSLQIISASVVWWWIWVRSGRPDFPRMSRRLFRVSVISWLLFLVAPVDFGTDHRGINWVFLLPQLDWSDWRSIGTNLSDVSSLLAPVLLFYCIWMQLRLRRKFGRALASLLSFNLIAMAFINWIEVGHGDRTYVFADVYLATSNLTAALYLWTSIIELRVLDRQWSEHGAEAF